MQSNLAIDGFVIASQDWRILKSTSFWPICPKIRASQLHKREYKGLSYLIDGEGYELTNTSANLNGVGIDQSIIITRPVQVGLNWEELHRVSTLFQQSLQRTIESLPPTAPTKCRYACRNSGPHFNRCNKCTSRTIIVSGGDICEFGNLLKVELERALNASEIAADNPWTVQILIRRLGQSPAWHSANSLLQALDLRYADEIIIHVAKDYFEDGKCLLWKFASVQGWEHYANNPIVYCNMMTGGHASFEIDNTDRTGFQFVTDEVKIANIKLYVDTFKEIHRGGKEHRWRHPKVLEALTSLKDYPLPLGQKWWPILPFLTDIKSLLNYVDTILKDAGRNEARLEAILCLKHARENWQHQGNAAITARFRDLFNATIDNQQGRVEQLLSKVNYADLLLHIDFVLKPVLNTLYQILWKVYEQREKKRVQGIITIPNSDKVQTAVACEMIVSFFIYGKLNHFPKNKGIRFPTKLIDHINLKPEYFAKRVAEIFTRFEHVNNVHLNADSTISYTGIPIFRDRYWQGLLGDLNNDVDDVNTLKEFITYVYTRRNAEEAGDMYFEFPDDLWNSYLNTLPPIFFKAITKWENLEGYPNEDVRSQLLRTAENVIERVNQVDSMFTNIVVETSLDFVKRLFEHPHTFKQIGIAAVAREIYYLLYESKRRLLICRIAMYLDEQLYMSRPLALFYPRSVNQYSLVLAYFGTAENNYRNGGETTPWLDFDSPLKQEKLGRLYLCAYARRWGKNEVDMLGECLLGESIRHFLESVPLLTVTEFPGRVNELELFLHDVRAHVFPRYFTSPCK